MVTPDDVYAALVEAHQDVDEPSAAALDARLILLLADALGDPGRVLELIAKARMAVQ
jgi:hypothetical protein